MEADFPNARIPATTFESFADVLIFWQWRVYLKNSLLASIGAAEERNLEDVFEDMFLGARGDKTRSVCYPDSAREFTGSHGSTSPGVPCESTWPPTREHVRDHVGTRGYTRVTTWRRFQKVYGYHVKYKTRSVIRSLDGVYG